MKKYFLFFSLYITLLFVSVFSVFASDQQGYSILTDAINKSDRDERQYRVIELANQMKVLLISDQKAVKSLASLALPVGSLHDPKSQQGLAHYTEHMVLMGSKKYPQAASFSEFLSQHAGSYNASTAAYRTAFYFEIENSAFLPALDRLADAIAEPLLDAKYADKERNAVNAELTIARSNDGFRIGQIDAETINQDHPAAMFSGGNLETLSDKPDSQLQTELEKFYHQYYSANIMVGVLYSNQSLDELASAAVTSFGQIRNNHIKVEEIRQEAIGPNNLAKLIYMEPAQSKKLLYIQFPINNNVAEFKDKSDEYISFMISNRSPNTLFSQLQQQGLIESISANSDPIRYGNSGIFSIVVNLTDQGMAEKDKVIADVFAYLKLLKQKGINQQYYDEIAKVLALEFRYPNISRDMSYVEWLSDQMLLYPVEHVLDADYVATHFNSHAIVDRLDSLTVDNARIWVIAPNQQTDKLAYFVNAPYRIEDINQQKINNLITNIKDDNFSLPLINPYIASDFSIFNQKTDNANTHYIFDSSGNNIHFVSEYFADEPKAAIMLSLRSNTSLSTVDNQVMFYLLDYLVNRELAILYFQASVAGVDISTGADNGLAISLSGFNQHLDEMLLTILNTYHSTTINDDNLQLAKSWYLEKLAAAEQASSYSLAMQPIAALSSVPYFERDSKRAALELITPEKLQQYRDELLSNSVPYMLSLGNITNDNSQLLYNKIKATLNLTAHYLPEKSININDKIDALISKKTNNTDNALLMGFIPKGYDKISSNMMSYFLYKIISPWFYDQLRSNEQLGYAVFSLPVTIGDSSGLGFLIQSNQYDPAYLNQRYQAFYPIILQKLNVLSDSEFAQYKQSIINELLMAPQTLDEEFDSYLTDYRESLFDFTSKQQKLERVSTLTKAELIEFYKQAIINSNGLVIGSEVLGTQADKVINGVKGFTEYSGASSLQNKLLSN